MAVDPKLRDVLDTLDEAEAASRPAEDREMLLTVLRRLELRDRVRHRPRPMPAADLEAERDAARRRQAELEALAHEQSMSDEKLRDLQAERDALLARQEELEDRLAQLEAASHGGSLSYVEEETQEPDPIVEFSRVDLDELGHEHDELMEFQDISSSYEPAHGESAWTPGGSDQNVEWDDAGDGTPHVDWDQQEDWAEPQEHAETWESEGDEQEWQSAGGDAWGGSHGNEETTWAAEPAPETPADETPQETSWADLAEQDSWSDEPAPTGAGKTAPAEDLDDKTRNDLAALERQLAELEAELAKRPKKREP